MKLDAVKTLGSENYQLMRIQQQQFRSHFYWQKCLGAISMRAAITNRFVDV